MSCLFAWSQFEQYHNMIVPWQHTGDNAGKELWQMYKLPVSLESCSLHKHLQKQMIA